MFVCKFGQDMVGIGAVDMGHFGIEVVGRDFEVVRGRT